MRIGETAVAAFLPSDRADQTEAAITRCLDRLTRTMERLERDPQITGEALAHFIGFWLTATPPMPDDLRAARRAGGGRGDALLSCANLLRKAKADREGRGVLRERHIAPVRPGHLRDDG